MHSTFPTGNELPIAGIEKIFISYQHWQQLTNLLP
jgi:hypothetical protein